MDEESAAILARLGTKVVYTPGTGLWGEEGYVYATGEDADVGREFKEWGPGIQNESEPGRPSWTTYSHCEQCDPDDEFATLAGALGWLELAILKAEDHACEGTP